MTVLCIHPSAIVFGGKGSFLNSIRIASLFYGYTITTSTTLFFVGLILFVNSYNSQISMGPGLALAFCFLPFCIILFRGFFKVFLSFYGITRMRLILVLIGAVVLSYLITPLYLYFGVYGTLKLKRVFDILFYTFLFIF